MTSGLEGVRGLVEEIAQQTPEKPDYWNSCSQCESNIDRAQAALAAEGVQAGEVERIRAAQDAAIAKVGAEMQAEQRARELLAAEWEVEGYPEAAKMLRAGWTLADEDAVAIRAIIAAMSQQPEAKLAREQVEARARAIFDTAYPPLPTETYARFGLRCIIAALTAAQQHGQAVACTVRNDTGLTVTADRLPHYRGVRLSAGTKLYTAPPPSAPVGVGALIAEDEAGWALAKRAEAAGAERDESDDDLWWTLRIEQFKAIAQQPAAVDEFVTIDGKRYDVDIVRTALLGLASDLATQHQEPTT